MPQQVPVQIIGAAVQPGRPFSPTRRNPYSLEDVVSGIFTSTEFPKKKILKKNF